MPPYVPPYVPPVEEPPAPPQPSLVLSGTGYEDFKEIYVDLTWSIENFSNYDGFLLFHGTHPQEMQQEEGTISKRSSSYRWHTWYGYWYIQICASYKGECQLKSNIIEVEFEMPR